jgi:hypothetical protein
MTPSQIAILSLRILGIFTLIECIPYLKSLGEIFAWQGSDIARIKGGPLNTDLILIATLVSFILQLAVGFFLWRYSGAIAAKMLPVHESKEPGTEPSAKNIQSIAFSIIGIVMVMMAIPILIQIATNLQALQSTGSESLKESISIATWAYSIGMAIQFILGILLFLGAKGLSSLWYFFQKLRPMKDV